MSANSITIRFATPDDLGNTRSLYSQALSPLAEVYLPFLRK